MEVNKSFPSNFGRIAIFILLFAFTKASITTYSNPLTDPCTGHKDGRARATDVDSSITRCSEYFECRNGEKTTPDPYICPADRPFFDAEVENCVTDAEKCFECSFSLDYELIAVPNAPIQFIQCFKQKSLLLACSDELEFDNRIKQCNVKQLCRTKNLTGRRCLDGGPHYEIDAIDPTVYYICWDQWFNQCGECPYGLQFNIYKGICEIL